MVKTAIITPSRGRPNNVIRLAKAFKDTQAVSDLWVVIDDDDWHSKDYERASEEHDFGIIRIENQTGGMAYPLNVAAEMLFDDTKYDHYDYFGFLGDDHIPRTFFWDYMLRLAIPDGKSGISYGNDLLQGSNLPTACLMTRSIVDHLGGMVMPDAKHLYLDNFWRKLGEDIQGLYYRPDVIIEHLHPLARKAQIDENYERVNSPAFYEHDREVFEDFIRSEQYANLVAALK